jgi:hypothetical protein
MTIPDPLRLSTNLGISALLGLTRQEIRSYSEPYRGALVFRWDGLWGGTGCVEIGADDTRCLAALERVADTKAFPELAALLTMAARRTGKQNWNLEPVLELLWGSDPKKSARSRQRQPLKDWLFLLEEGLWTIDAPVRRGSPEYGCKINRWSLLNIKGGVLVLHPKLLAALTFPSEVVAPEAFRITGKKRLSGNGPSFAALARIRLAGAMVARAHLADDGAVQALRLQHFLSRWAGIRVHRISERKSWGAWLGAVEKELPVRVTGTGANAMVRFDQQVNPNAQQVNPNDQQVNPNADPSDQQVNPNAEGS